MSTPPLLYSLILTSPGTPPHVLNDPSKSSEALMQTRSSQSLDLAHIFLSVHEPQDHGGSGGRQLFPSALFRIVVPGVMLLYGGAGRDDRALRVQE